MLNNGWSVIFASKRIGHSSPSTTSDVSRHLFHELRNDAPRIMDDLVSAIPVETTEKAGTDLF